MRCSDVYPEQFDEFAGNLEFEPSWENLDALIFEKVYGVLVGAG